MCIGWMAGFYRSSSDVDVDVDVDGIQTPEGGQLAERERIGEAIQLKTSKIQL